MRREAASAGSEIPDVHYARTSDGFSIAYQVVGDGPIDVLYVQGYLSNIAYAWEIPPFASYLRRLARFSRLIAFDRRGSGLSDRLGPGDAPPLDALMEDLRVVMDAAGSKRAAVFGVFDGSVLAATYAASHPDRVSALVLYSSSPAGSARDGFPWQSTEQEWEATLSGAASGWGERAWSLEHQVPMLAPSLLDEPETLERWLTFERLTASPASVVASLRIVRDTDIRAILPSIHVPTLVLHRKGDRTKPPEAGRYVASLIPGARFVELPGDDGMVWAGDPSDVMDEVEEFLTGTRPEPPVDRVLATVVFTDIVASTQRIAEVGDARWRSLLEEHHAVVRHEIARWSGREVNTAGDGFFVTFDGPARAVRCAGAIVEAVRPLGVEVRAGVHTGEVELAGEDVRGIAVHIGARVESLAGPSEVLVSQTVKDLVAGSGLVFEDAGEHELKGVPDRWRLYRVGG